MSRTASPRRATSEAAAAAIQSEMPRLCWKVYQHIKRRGARGATDEEGDDRLQLGSNTYRPRRVQLVADGRVKDSGAKRPTASGRNAIVWVAV